MDYKRPQKGFKSRKQASIYCRNKHDESKATEIQLRKYRKDEIIVLGKKKIVRGKSVYRLLGKWETEGRYIILEPSKYFLNTYIAELKGRKTKGECCYTKEKVFSIIKRYIKAGFVQTEKYTEYGSRKSLVTVLPDEEREEKNRRESAALGQSLVDWMSG